MRRQYPDGRNFRKQTMLAIFMTVLLAFSIISFTNAMATAQNSTSTEPSESETTSNSTSSSNEQSQNDTAGSQNSTDTNSGNSTAADAPDNDASTSNASNSTSTTAEQAQNSTNAAGGNSTSSANEQNANSTAATEGRTSEDTNSTLAAQEVPAANATTSSANSTASDSEIDQRDLGYVTISGEPLTPSASAISRTFTYPTLAFEGQVEATLEQTITWKPDGTTIISDDRGYQYSIAIPTSGNAFTLLQNSTVVDQKFVGSLMQYDIYWSPVRNPDGFVDKYKFTIVGASANGGKLSFGIDNYDKYLIVDKDRMLISNVDIQTHTPPRNGNSSLTRLNETSGAGESGSLNQTTTVSTSAVTGIGLDWSDALEAGYNMTFNSETKALEVIVAKSFSIDPTTIAQTGTAVSPIMLDYQQGQKRVVKVGNSIFAFYHDGTNIVYKYSTDGGDSFLPSGAGISAGTGTIASDTYSWTLTSTTYSGYPRLVLAYYTYDGTATSFKVKSGQVFPDNSITWTDASPSPLFSDTSIAPCGAGACAAASAATGTDGKVFVLYRWFSQPLNYYAFKIMNSTNGGLNWSVSLNTVSEDPGLRPSLTLTKLAAGKMLLAYVDAGGADIKYRVYSGTTWGSVQTITGAFTGGVARHISADSDSTGKPYVAFATGGNSGTLKVATWTNAGGSPSIQTADSSLSHALPSISITFDNIIHIFSIANSKVYETKKIGSTWQTPSNPLGTTFNSLDMLTSATSDSYALWKENSGPYDIRFGTTTPTDFRLESSGEQRVTYFDGTNIWRFFYDSTSQNIFYQYSSDNGVSWSSTSSTGSGALAANSYFSVFGEGNTVLVSGASLTKAFTIKGTITGTTIVWGSLVQVFAVSGTNAGQQYYPSFEKVGTSLFLGFNVITKGKNVGHVYKSTNLGTSWGASAEITLYTGETNPGIVGVTEYGSSNLIAVYARNADTEFQYRLRSSGGTWTGPFSTAGAGLATGLKTSAFSITSDGTCAWTGYVPNNSGGQLRAIQFCDSGGSLVHVVKQLTSGTNLYPTITSENGNIQLLYMQSGTVRAVTNFNIGSGDWQSEVRPFGYTFDNAAYLHAEKNLPGGSTSSVPVVWRERTAVPFAIKMSTTNPVNWLTHVEAGDDFLSEQQQIEPHIAASRSSTQQDTVVAGYIHYSPGPQCRVSRSTDSGATWQFGEYGGNENLPNGGHGFGGDPSSASSTDGTFYYACYGNNLTNDLQDPDPTDGTWKRIDTSSINFVKSTDNGLTWTDAATQIFRSNEQAQLDKPWIAVEWGAAGGSRVYACWNEFDYANHQTRIKFAQILPSFANEITIDSSTWSINGERRAGPYVLGCQLTTGPGTTSQGNEIFIAYEKIENYNTGKILFNRNYDAGATSGWLAQPIEVATFNRVNNAQSFPCGSTSENKIADGCLQGILGTSFRIGQFPSLAVDKQGDPHLVWPTFNVNNMDIAYSSSYDCSASERQCNFSSAIVIDSNTNDQFEPAITVSDSAVNPRGIVIITANDKREDTDGKPNETWKPWSYVCIPTTVSGQGSCGTVDDWINFKLSDDVTLSTDTFIGDYHALTFTRSNQAISINYWRDCTPGCIGSSSDIVAHGGK